MKITRCRVNHMKNPVGFSIECPVFSYAVEEAQGKRQTAARIVVTADAEGREVLADTGWDEKLSSLACPLPLALSPRTRYFWTVVVRSDAGEEAKSGTNFFETGKRGEPWEAKWITTEAQPGEDGSERHPVFSKCFEIEKEIISARLYIAGLGLYEAKINGARVGEEHLTPYCNDYDSWVQYQTYDVTELLQNKNRLEVLLGNGWYKGRFGFESKPGDRGHFDGDWKLIAELRVTCADGSSRVIGTDESWEVRRSNIVFSNIYDGEHRDDTLPETEHKPAALLPMEKCEALVLKERLSLPVVKQEELVPVELLHTPAGEQVFDLGQNFAGIFRLRVCEPAGKEIRVQVGEVLQNGCFYRDNLRTAKAEFVYISDGEEHVLEPKFTYYGYRYAKVTGVSKLKREDFTGIALYSDIETVGALRTGDALLNQLLSNISWGQKGNFLDVPTDCPQRDERMGWTADTQVFVPTACCLTDSFAFYRKYLYDMRMEQKKYDGLVPNVVPSFGMGETSSVWGDAATIIPWTLYQYYGDESILRECLPSMVDWVEYIKKVDGMDCGWRKVFHFGDWLALDHPKGGADQVAGGTEEGYIADIYYRNSALLTAEAAAVLGEEKTVETYRTLAGELKQRILDEYFTPTGRCAITTMTGYVLALYYDLAPDRERVGDALLKLLKDKNYKIQTGFVGTPLILKVLSDLGEEKIACQILHNEEYPGWLYAVKLGATTVWERWNSVNPDGSISSTGMNSLNHYAYGSVGEWMWQNLAGIRQQKPGFKRATLRPVPDYPTGEVEVSYKSPAGTYRLFWKVLDLSTVRLSVEVPFDCTARLVLPWAKGEKERELVSGHYEFTLESEEPLKEVFSVDTPLSVLLDNPKTCELLTNKMPQITQLPERMRSASLRQMLSKNPQMEALLPAIDTMLQKL